MKTKKKRNYLKETGITLIALVVTIVVLLILAGVSLNAIFSENGIIKRAQDAQNKANESVQKDLEQINALENWLNQNIGEEDGIKLNFNGYTPSTWTNKDIIINLSMSNEQGEKYQYSNDKNTWTDCGSTITIDNDQEKTYYFRRVDSNGNSICETKEYEIKRDTEAPTFNVDLTADSSSVTCKITDIKDNGSGTGDSPQISIEYKKLEDTNYITAYNGNNNEYKIDGLGEMLKNVTYVIKVSIKDRADNIKEVIKDVTVKSKEILKELAASGYEISYTFNNYPADLLTIFNSNSFSVAEIINKYDEDGTMSEYKACTQVTKFFSLTPDYNDPDANVIRDENGYYVITLENLGKVDNTYYILCYNTGTEMFEIVKPYNIDTDNKSLSVKLEDTSAMAIIKSN